MRRRLLVIASLVLAMAAVAMAADDPFTGTWRRQITQLTITPTGHGYSIQENKGKPTSYTYGKDFIHEGGFTVNTVRVDDHTLAYTSMKEGKVISKETATVSPDGKHYTRSQELAGSTRKFIIKYDRVGSVPPGDAFFGTWRQTSPITTHTIKVDGDMFYLTENASDLGDLEKLTIKLDGKKSKGADGETIQARRIDAQTIERIQKFGDGKNSFEVKIQYKVQGVTLMETQTASIPNEAPSKTVTNFERIK
jgi:hypothetical protein